MHLTPLLRAGGILYDVTGTTKSAVLRALVARLPLAASSDRAALLAALEAREAAGSTGIGDGIAIPHVSDPLTARIDAPFMTFALLGEPVEFDATDGVRVHAIILPMSSARPAHLAILARLGFVLRDQTFRDALRSRAGEGEIFAQLELLEAATR
jgi:PTS system nitrogen regulatory IIA component